MKRFCILFVFSISIFHSLSQTLLTEDFEQTSFPSEGWTLINGNHPLGYTWTHNTDSTLGYVNFTRAPYPAFRGSGSIVYEFDTTAAEAWAITPPLELTNGISYTITFYYVVFKSEYPEKLKVTVGTAPTIEAQTAVLWDNGGTKLTNDATWIKATINYSPASSGSYYFGFNCHSDRDMFALIVDDIRVESSPTVVPPCANIITPLNGATQVTAPQALFTWDSASTAQEYVFKLGTTNSPDSIGFLTGSAAYQSNLAYNTTYYWSVVPKNAAGTATGCPVYSFTTQPAPPIPGNDECTGAIPIVVGETVPGSTKSATESMPAGVCAGNTGNANDDVWFKFIPIQSGDASITLTPDLIFDGVINAYSGSCQSLTSISCADSGFDGEPETLTLKNVVAGETYYFRVYGFDNAGKDGSFNLTIASGTTLPVTFTNLKGEQKGQENVLSWNTLTEHNNKGFELQRSVNGKDFNTLDFIRSKARNGNSSLSLIYQYTDSKPLTSDNYYRLKQVDIDGKSATSNTVLVRRFEMHPLSLSNAYPNPAKSFVNILLTAPSATAVNLIITDVAGKPLMQRAGRLAVGENNLSLNVNILPAGTYIIKVMAANGQTVITKFIKQ